MTLVRFYKADGTLDKEVEAKPGQRLLDVAWAAKQPLEGACEGEIWPEPRGLHGFGYDPIFYFPEYGRTFGEVTDAEKLAVAHRGRAFRRLGQWLATRAESLR